MVIVLIVFLPLEINVYPEKDPQSTCRAPRHGGKERMKLISFTGKGHEPFANRCIGFGGQGWTYGVEIAEALTRSTTVYIPTDTLLNIFNGEAVGVPVR